MTPAVPPTDLETEGRSLRMTCGVFAASKLAKRYLIVFVCFVVFLLDFQLQLITHKQTN